MVTLKMRYCWNCGEELGMIADKNYVRTDTCGNQECERALLDMMQEEREEAHRRLDRDLG
jgi:anaerobic ribonucleoside-triphosphate reductase